MYDLSIKQSSKFIEKETADFPKVIYPKIELPLSFIADKSVKRDTEIELRFKGKIVGFEDSEWHKIVTLELKEGEIVGKGKAKEREKEITLLGESAPDDTLAAVINL